MKKIILFAALTCFYLTVSAQEKGSFKDPRDGKTYKTVKIDKLWIMAENLAFKPAKGNCWAYKNDQKNVAKYGYLYDWATAKAVVPAGWHLPTKAEWESIYKFLGDDDLKVYTALIPSGKSGFDALFAGFGRGDGTYDYIDKGTYFWSSTPKDANSSWNFYCTASNKGANRYHDKNVCGLSVRLIKD